jgi:hypothetical protein
MNSHLVFFSSDASVLYKADIYRCLALPAEYTIQFRYRPRWVHETVRRSLSKIKSRTGIIFFVPDIDQKTSEREPQFEWYPIRWCTVIDAFLEQDIDQITFILKLDGFVACNLSESPVRSEALPPRKFVSEIALEDIHNITWIEAVHSVRAHFAHLLFCHIVGVLRNSEFISAEYSETLRHSYFPLEEDTEYAIKCICYEPERENRSLLIRYQGEEIEVSNSFESGIGAGIDVRLLPLRTRVLKVHSTQMFFTFYSPNPMAAGQPIDPNQSDPNHFRIWWQIRRKPSRIILFGVCSSALALALVLTQVSGKLCSPWNFALAFVAIVITGCAAAGLFNFFNKM